ncbi:unnamed protein product [Linum trigynum]
MPADDASASATQSTEQLSKRKRNEQGSRIDPAWQYVFDVNADAKSSKCKFCSKLLSGGAFRLKHHLAGTKQNAAPCPSVPDDVRRQMLELLDFNLEAKEVRKNLIRPGLGVNSSEASAPVESVQSSIPNRGKKISNSNPPLPNRRQSTMSQLLKKDLRHDACRGIARWFYNNALSFNASRDDLFGEMFELVARHGPGFKPPSYHELRETLLKEELKEVEGKLAVFKEEWKSVGCTIMSDGWTDRKRRSICNFLVNSPRGTSFVESIDTSGVIKNTEKVFQMLDNIVEKVGEEHVVQVVTDNASAYKAAGERLMAKRKHLFWTPCAAHCLDLVLEDFEKHLPVHKTTISKGKKISNFIYARTNLIAMMKEFTNDRDLVRAGATRFATSYLSLARLSEQKGNLMTMFASEKWRKSSFASIQEGKRIQGIALDGRFWTNVVNCLRAALPVVKVLRFVDGEEKPSMPFLFQELCEAKLKIKSNFSNMEKR